MASTGVVDRRMQAAIDLRCSVKDETEGFSLGEEREREEKICLLFWQVWPLSLIYIYIYSHKDSIMKLYLITFILIISQ